MNFEIVYAESRNATREIHALSAGLTVGDALRLSPLAQALSGGLIESLDVGIFGERCAHSRVLKAGDRIELYRDLSVDPKTQRRARAKG